MIVSVNSTDLSLKAYDTPHQHPVFQCNCKQATELCQKKGIGQKWEQLLLTQPMLKTDISSHPLRQFFALWWKTDQQATSTVSNQRICHPLYHAQQNNFLKRNASLSSLFQVKSLHRVKKVDQSMIRHLPGLPWPPVLQSGDLVQSLPQMASRSMNDPFQQWINTPFSPRFSRSDPRWWHLSGLGAQRRCCVVGPVSPGASGQTILGHGSYGRDQKHRVAAPRLLMILENHGMIICDNTIWCWYDMIWFDLMWYDMIWFDMIGYDMIWYEVIWYVMARYEVWNVIANCVYNFFNKQMNSIKSANVISLCMFRRHYMNCTTCSCHIMKLFIPGTFYNSLFGQAVVSIAVT